MKEWEMLLIGVLKNIRGNCRDVQYTLTKEMISQYGPLSDEAAEKVKQLLGVDEQ